MSLSRRLFRLIGREPAPEEDIAAEFEAHLALKTEALVRAGFPTEEARREAERRFGTLERFAAECRTIDRAERRERRRREWWASAFQDLRLAARGLLRAPGFALTATLVLAAGLGLNATVFTVLRGVVLRPLPYPRSERLISIYSSNPKAGWPTFSVAPTDFYDWERDARSFAAMVAWSDYPVAATGGGAAEQVPVVAVTAGFRQVAGTGPQLGRSFLPGEFERGAPLVAMLAHDVWATRFGGDPAVLGRRWILDGESYQIIGVMPAGFAFPVEKVAGWIPFHTPADVATQRGAHYVNVVGRLADGATLEGARSELVTLAARIAQAYPRSSAGWSVVLRTMHEDVVGEVRPTLLLLMAGGALLLVLTCANVANLVLVRAIGRSGEVAVRSALGAGRGRLLWHGASEVLVLVAAGAVAAIPIAALGTASIRRLAPEGVPRLTEVRLDLPVAAFILALTLVAALFVSLAPARRIARSDLRLALGRAGGRGVSSRRRLHRWLVALETAIALALLATAGVLLKSKQRLEAVAPGFDPSAVLVGNFSLPDRGYPDGAAIVRFERSLLARLRAMPGVKSVALVFGLPLSGFVWSASFTIDSIPVPDGKSQSAQLREVTPDYFGALRIPILSGRGFTEADRHAGRQVLVVSAAAVRRFWPDGNVLGRFVRMGARPGPGDERVEGEIVGVAGDVREQSLDKEPRPIVYASVEQVPVGALTVVLRTEVAPTSLAPELRRSVAALDPDLPVTGVRSMEDVVRAATAGARFRAWLMGFFALLAATLAGLGVYGVVSHVVAQRTREIGLRRALGASDRRVVAEVVAAGMLDAAVGAAAGLLLGGFITTRLTRLLYQVRPADPLVLAIAAALFLGVALVACWVPARRATAADPVSVLRGE